MDLGEFSSELIPLTIRNPETGRMLTASVYTIEGLEGTFSMGQLVFAICMAIGLDREQALVDIMDEANVSTAKLKTLTDIQAALIDWFNEAGNDDKFNLEFGSDVVITYDGKYYGGADWRNFLWEVCDMSYEQLPSKPQLTRTEVETLIDSISDKMDALNAINNDQLIQMQSVTAKRDQAFDLLSNILKSFTAQLLGNANNL